MTKRIPVHLRQSVMRIESAEISAPPSPWQNSQVFHVGGLTAVGFGPGSDLLLALSHDGRGVFDCLTRERVAREAGDEFRFDTIALEADGFGPLAGQRIHTAGIHGGALPRGTHDGWNIESLTLNWPEEIILLTSPGNWHLADTVGKPAQFTKICVDTDIRASGFSPTGRSLIIATDSDITLYAR